jgi:hypothetical protein
VGLARSGTQSTEARRAASFFSERARGPLTVQIRAFRSCIRNPTARRCPCRPGAGSAPRSMGRGEIMRADGRWFSSELGHFASKCGLSRWCCVVLRSGLQARPPPHPGDSTPCGDGSSPAHSCAERTAPGGSLRCGVRVGVERLQVNGRATSGCTRMPTSAGCAGASCPAWFQRFSVQTASVVS